MVGGHRVLIPRQTVGSGCWRGIAGMPGVQSMYVTLQRCRKMSVLEGDVHVWGSALRPGPSLLRRRLFGLIALPVADKYLAQFVLLSLILDIYATRHAERFADIVHGAVESELAGKLC